MLGQVYQPPLDERVSLLSQFPHCFELLWTKSSSIRRKLGYESSVCRVAYEKASKHFAFHAEVHGHQSVTLKAKAPVGSK